MLALSGAAWLAGARVRADDTGLHVWVAPGSCPSAELVSQKLSPLVGDEVGELDISSSALVRSGYTEASVRDLGGDYVVEIEGQRRELRDTSRDCVERARVAAVFLALNLKSTPGGPTRSRAVRAGLRLFGEGAYATEIDRGSAGGSLGVWVERGCFRLDLGAGVHSPVELPLPPPVTGPRASASLIRIPMRATVTCLFHAGDVLFGPTLGFGADLLRIHGADVERPQTELRASPGLLVAADLRLPLSPAWSLALRLSLEATARVYELRLNTPMVLGTTPRLWLSAGLGLEWRFL